jgi:hypothetical protein
MNAHKGILIEMKCDRSFEIITLLVKAFLKEVRRRQLSYLQCSIPKPSETHSRLASTHIDLLSDVMLDFVWFAPAAAIILETLPSGIRVGL